MERSPPDTLGVVSNASKRTFTLTCRLIGAKLLLEPNQYMNTHGEIKETEMKWKFPVFFPKNLVKMFNVRIPEAKTKYWIGTQEVEYLYNIFMKIIHNRHDFSENTQNVSMWTLRGYEKDWNCVKWSFVHPPTRQHGSVDPEIIAGGRKKVKKHSSLVLGTHDRESQNLLQFWLQNRINSWSVSFKWHHELPPF